jgi:hypothetical protein
MFQFLFTDFIRNRTIQLSIAISIFFDIIISRSTKQTLILFGLPYLTSIALCCRYEQRKNLSKARISAQYRSKQASRP